MLLFQTKSFLAGNDFTMADVYFFPYLAFAVRMGMDIEKYPNLKAYYEKVCGRPSIKATWPPHWKEEPPKFSPLQGQVWIQQTRTLVPI